MKSPILFLIFTCVTHSEHIILNDTRIITGKVVDDAGNHLMFASIVAYDTDYSLLNGTETDMEGKFSLTVSTTCKWLEASFIGMQSVRIEIGEGSDYAICMKAGVVLDEVVIVEYKVPLVERDNTTTGRVIKKITTAERIRNLPTKNINALAATTSGLSSIDGGKISIRSSRTEATGYYIDGVRVSGTLSGETVPGESETPMIIPGSDQRHPESERDIFSAGQLTAGEINDLGKWILWNDKSHQELREHQNTWSISPSKRYTVMIQNTNGLPMVGKTVYLLDKEKNSVWSAKTDNVGRAELWSDVFDKTSEDTKAFSIVAEIDGKEYFVKNATPFERGVNHMIIDHDCDVSNVVDAVFIVDATGSMGDEIQYLKEELQDVIRNVKDNHPGLILNLGSVFYRDHGDTYVTRTSKLSSDISQTITFIQDQTAGGGGDGPEALDEALEVAVNNINWSADSRAKIIFVVLDAPPHTNSDNLKRLRDVMYNAAKQGIRIIPITASGIDKSTEYLMRSLALCTNGTYVFLTDHSGIGNPHLEPTTDTYDVEKLNDLLVRLFDQFSSVVSCANNELIAERISDTTKIESRTALMPDSLADVELTDTEMVAEWITCTFYPNPSSGVLNIEITGKIQELYLSDVSGKLLEKFKTDGNEKFQIDISRYPVGTYLLMYFDGSDRPKSGIVVHAK